MIQKNKVDFIELAESRADEYKNAISEAVSRQLVSIAYHYEHLENIKN